MARIHQIQILVLDQIDLVQDQIDLVLDRKIVLGELMLNKTILVLDHTEFGV